MWTGSQGKCARSGSHGDRGGLLVKVSPPVVQGEIFWLARKPWRPSRVYRLDGVKHPLWMFCPIHPAALHINALFVGDAGIRFSFP